MPCHVDNVIRRWLARVPAIVGGALLAVAACSCAGSGPSDNSATVITLAENPWSGSRVDAAVAAALLEDTLGYTVEIVPVDEYAQWPALATGALHACLEVWPSGHAADIADYIDALRSVQHAGALGVIGKIGWYVPSYVIAQHPALATWEGLLDPANADLFRTAASGARGQFLAGDPTWVQHDAQIIHNLGLNLEVVYAGSEAALLAQIGAAYDGGAPLLFYFYTPHAAHARWDLSEVRLPPYSDACYARADADGVDCDYPTDELIKVVWSGLADYAPRAHAFLSRMHYSTADQTELLAAVDLQGMTPEQAARSWIAVHPDIWRAWLP